MVLNALQCTGRPPPPTKNYPIPDVNSAEIQNPSPRECSQRPGPSRVAEVPLQATGIFALNTPP